MAKHYQKNINDKRLHALTREMHFLSSELAALQGEGSTAENLHDAERLATHLSACCKQWQLHWNQAESSEAAPEVTPYRKEGSSQALTFKETVENLSGMTSFTPECLWVEYQSLVDEGYDNPLLELAQTYREALLILLLDHSGISPSDLTELQDGYLSAHAARQIREAIQLMGKARNGQAQARLGQ